MRRPVRAGLIPLYLELYDRVLPEQREAFPPFLSEVKKALNCQDIEIHLESICRTAQEVGAAVARLEAADVDILITLHLAYSPSLESIRALEETKLPLLLLDTTMDAVFGLETSPQRIGYNHGIHGVQDLASVLLRRERPFKVVAGHRKNSPVIERAAEHARAAAAANALRSMSVLRIGPSFEGMGDFAVNDSTLREGLGIRVIHGDAAQVAEAAAALREDDVLREMEEDERRYAIKVSTEIHKRSVQAALALRAVTEASGCGACSFNFLAFESSEGPLSTCPFLGASKMMLEGFGYAGEGDVLTAALVGALNRSFLVNFTEMFCADWEGDSIFLSHMGEFNPACAQGEVRLVEKDFPFTGAQNPAILVGAMKEGPAVLINLAPGPSGSFRLLAAPVEVLPDSRHADMHNIVRGWFRAETEVASFLEWYSTNGGTHHCALVHNTALDTIVSFASYCGIPCVTPPERNRT